MPVIKQPFKRYNLKTDRDSLKHPIHINKGDLERLEAVAEILQEEKLGSTIKAVMDLGITYLLNDPVGQRMGALFFRRKLNNERLGIVEAEPDFRQKYNVNK